MTVCMMNVDSGTEASMVAAVSGEEWEEEQSLCLRGLPRMI
jgi:hypothetical protein